MPAASLADAKNKTSIVIDGILQEFALRRQCVMGEDRRSDGVAMVWVDEESRRSGFWTFPAKLLFLSREGLLCERVRR